MFASPVNNISLFPANTSNMDSLVDATTITSVRNLLADVPKSRCGRSTVHYNVALADPPAPAELHVDETLAPYEPAERISEKWMEYQGSNNWRGLLHPLDHNLRLEILRYGEFVEAAYRAFDFDPDSRTFATCKYPRDSLLTRSGIRETGYKLTRHLWATCGVQLPEWMDKMPSWMSTPTGWIGYVAVCQNKKEISRLGRRDVVIALRGTGTCLEWIENLHASLTGIEDEDDNEELDGPRVQSGFLRMYTSGSSGSPSLRDTIREEIRRIMRTYGDEPLSITFTGHSLGAALAKIAAYDIRTTIVNSPMVTVVSFGGPRVGNTSFRCHLEQSGTKILRIVNSDDVVTKVPGFGLEEAEWTNNNKAVQVTGLPDWFQKSVENMRCCWDYADVGQELRLSSRMSPCHIHTNGNMATCHELKTYLQLVNGFVCF